MKLSKRRMAASVLFAATVEEMCGGVLVLESVARDQNM